MITTTYASVSLYKIDTLDNSAYGILEFARALFADKQYLPRADFNKMVESFGWSKEIVRSYIKLGMAFIDVEISKLVTIEPRTLFKITSSKRFASVVLGIKNAVGHITQQFVQNLIDGLKVPRASLPDKPTIWRGEKDTSRTCVIPPIKEDDQYTGTSIQRAMDDEKITAQRFVREAAAFREAFKYGAFKLVGELPPHLKAILGLEYEAPMSSNNDSEAQAITLVEETAPDVEVVQTASDVQAAPHNNFIVNKVCPENKIKNEQPSTIPPAESYSAAEIAALLCDCNTWSEITAITLNLDKHTRMESWLMLSKEEKNRIHEIKSIATEAKNQNITTDEAASIKVGDIVVWDNCYPHLSSWQPFQVQRIEINGFVKLENVINLIPIEELKLA